MPRDSFPANRSPQTPEETGDPPKARACLLQALENKARDFDTQIKYYKSQMNASRPLVWGLRTAAALSFAGGTVAPVVETLTPDGSWWDPLAVGYALLVCSGVFIVLDRALLASANRTGYCMAMTELESLKRNFEIDIARFRAIASNDEEAKNHMDEVFATIRLAEAELSRVVQTQTETWRDNSKAASAELFARVSGATQPYRSALSENVPARPPASTGTGSVAAKLTGGVQGPVSVRLGGETQHFDKAPENVTFSNVSAGGHTIHAEWDVEGERKKAEQAVEVPEGGAVETEVVLDHQTTSTK